VPGAPSTALKTLIKYQKQCRSVCRHHSLVPVVPSLRLVWQQHGLEIWMLPDVADAASRVEYRMNPVPLLMFHEISNPRCHLPISFVASLKLLICCCLQYPDIGRCNLNKLNPDVARYKNAGLKNHLISFPKLSHCFKERCALLPLLSYYVRLHLPYSSLARDRRQRQRRSPCLGRCLVSQE
jgi:hypothetical protein